MKELAPVAIFVFRRPDHLKGALESLKQCPEFDATKFFVFSDGPRNAIDAKGVEEVRKLAKEMLGNKAEYFFQEHNIGLSKSIIQGTNEVLKKHKNIIVLEDDLVLSKNFLWFMNTALDKYENSDNVFQVSGHNFISADAGRTETIMLPFSSSWGWGTWKRAWSHFDPQATGWEIIKADRFLRKRFNLEGIYDYSKMLTDQMEGKIDSWAVRWYWTIFNNDGIIVYPPYTLVQNTGFDGSGTHGKGIFRKFGEKQEVANCAITFTNRLEVNPDDYKLIKNAIFKMNGGWTGYTLDKVKKIVRYILRK